ncbi:MAG: GMC family oxidoreductase [Alphaproteobacteria bacterium]|nr:GMC family oxidoreductase [Alphaproteobacteria bacterium]
MIRSGADVPEGFELDADVCIVGSGAGGGVAAALFAEAGRDVVVLEEGPHVPGAQMTQREEQMYDRMWRDGGNQTTTDGAVSVLQGRVVGGSTVVNMADIEPVPAEILAHWRSRFGLTRWAEGDVREADDACRAVIGANVIPESSLNRNNAKLLEGGRKLGVEGGTFEHNRVGCVGSGYCLVGCAYDAKRSVAVTWIPRALATGRALVQSEARVERIEHDGRRVTAVHGSVVRPADSRALAPFTVRAKHFVLAAGAVHTPVLMLGSGIGGALVGRNLSLQPQTPCVALFPDEVVLFRGIPQSAWIHLEGRSEAEGLGGFRLEGVSSTPGMSAAMSALPTSEIHAFMSRYRQVAACLCLVPDRPSGEVVRARSGRPEIRYTLTDDVKHRMKEAVRLAARAWLAAGAEQVMLPFPDATPVRREADLAQLDRLSIRTASTAMISAHPQGTCRMGADPRTSVVDLRGFVHGIENLQVLDASLFPTTASTHTMLPVMSFAWLGTREVVG